MQGFLPSSNCLSPHYRVRIAIVLSILMLFFGIALFSPLHKHTPGKNYCSLNNIEHQIVSLAEAAIIVVPVAHLIDIDNPPSAVSPFNESRICARDRAPPAFS